MILNTNEPIRAQERSGMDADVISFPQDKITRTQEISTEAELQVAKEDIEIRVKLMKTMHIQDVVEVLMPIIFSQLAIGGFDLSDLTELKDAAFITEAIRSVLCKQKGILHPFQQLADKIFMDQEDGVLSIVDKIDLNFENEVPPNISNSDS